MGRIDRRSGDGGRPDDNDGGGVGTRPLGTVVGVTVVNWTSTGTSLTATPMDASVRELLPKILNSGEDDLVRSRTGVDRCGTSFDFDSPASSPCSSSTPNEVPRSLSCLTLINRFFILTSSASPS